MGRQNQKNTGKEVSKSNLLSLNGFGRSNRKRIATALSLRWYLNHPPYPGLLHTCKALDIVVTDSETEPNDQSQEGGQPGTRKRYAGPQYIGSGERGAVGRDALAAQEDVGPGLAIRVGSCCDGGLREDTGYLGRWAVFAGFVSLLISNLEPSNSSFSCCCPPPSLPKERKGGELHRLETNKTF